MNTPRRSTLRKRYDAELASQGFAPDPQQFQALEKLDLLRMRLIRAERTPISVTGRLLSALRAPKQPLAIRGVYLWGGVGRGKTWLMDLFFQSLPFERRQRSHFHRFMHDVHERLKRLKNQSNPLTRIAEDLAAKTRVICFDELLVGDIADAMILGTLFEQLTARGVTLVFTANVPPDKLYRNGLQRARFLPAILLLNTQLDVVAIDGDTDYRLRQLTQASIYLASGAAETPFAMQRLYDDLADDEADDGVRGVRVQGRDIAILRESENVIWFDFAALCDGPRSQADYIEIAREYQSVLVSNVPQFGTNRDNEARRFIALVDEFYDRRVKIILSAAAPPTELYQGNRLAFEFARTVSRLIEMQSRDYLSREHRG